MTRSLDRSKCTLQVATVPDKPWVPRTVTQLAPLAKQSVAVIDGTQVFTAKCPSSAGLLTASTKVAARDGQPERCADYVFTETPVSAMTYSEFRVAMVGTWEGCVSTPWTPDYWITLTLRDDGTYDVSSVEVLDGWNIPAFYWGTDAPSPEKVWILDDIQASGLGVGTIDLTFGLTGSLRVDLRHIAPMGDSLKFEVVHEGTSGPLVARLHRASAGD